MGNIRRCTFRIQSKPTYVYSGKRERQREREKQRKKDKQRQKDIDSEGSASEPMKRSLSLEALDAKPIVNVPEINERAVRAQFV